MKPLSEAQEINSNHKINPKHRLEATKIAAEIALTLTEATEEKHKDFEKELEELKKQL